MKFIEVNTNTTVNVDAITRIERLDQGTLVIMPDQSIVADIPYDTMVGILQEKDIIESMPDKSGGMAEAVKALEILTQNSQFTRI